jgi:hypothetical protein
VVLIGTALLPLSLEGLAMVNVVAVCLWIAVTLLILRERRRLGAQFHVGYITG